MSQPLSGAAFEIDVSELHKAAYYLKGPSARGVINRHLVSAGKQSGDVLQRNANSLTNIRTGRMVKTSTQRIEQHGASVSTIVFWPAKSKRGFPYPWTVNYGRGPVIAKPGKVLRFEIGGQVLYRKRVGPAKAQHFAERGLAMSKGAIDGIFASEIARAMAEVEGGL